MDWEDLVPSSIAIEQRSWERRQLVKRMIELRIERKEIARRLAVSTEWINILYRRSKRERLCPVIRYSGAVLLDILEKMTA